MSENTPPAPARTHVIASAGSWIEGEAVRQLEKTAQLPGMRLCVGMPDLHPGKGNPIGASFLSVERIYPYLVGNDIGCGMGLWRTPLQKRKARRDKWAERLRGLEQPWDGDATAFLSSRGVPPSEFESALGTIGGGNHFAELQQVEEVLDAAAFARIAGAEADGEDALYLLVHSGSRGLGDAILRSHVEKHGAEGLEADGEAAAAYLARHEHAVAWARANRALIAERFLDMLSTSGERLLDVCHNSVTKSTLCGGGFLHRKGAAPADMGPVVIPGSRGTLSYLVQPTDAGQGEQSACSLAHGAGRRWRRGDSKARLVGRYRPADLQLTPLGGRVICDDRDLLYEEAPQAYKDIDSVVGDLLGAGLIQVVATLRPLITYKTRNSESGE